MRKMKIILAQITGMVTLMGLLGCNATPVVPQELAGQSLIVLGFSTQSAQPYEGGTLYTGFRMEQLDGEAIAPLTRSQSILVAPGHHRLTGQCYWRLRGVLDFKQDDFTEQGALSLTTRPDTIYTIQSDIDEYKFQCTLTVIQRANR